MSGAERQARHRERERAGKMLLVLEVDGAPTIDMLVRAALLDGRQAYFDREEVAAAAAEFLRLSRDA